MLALYEKYGYYKETQYAITLKGIDGAAQISAMMEKLRSNPPKNFGDLQVVEMRDYDKDQVKDMATGEVRPTGLPKSNVLYFELTNNSWCCARPSGTEPKIKFYMGVKGTSLEDAQAKLAQTLETCWDEDRFIRGIREDGVIVGAKKDPEANMWLNPQSWSVISGFASKEQADTAMQSVADILDTPYGAKLLEPPYRHHYFDGALMHIFNLDTKENGGIFSQSQGWLILAEALLGHGNAAFRYFTESSPAAMNDKAEIRVMEPYVHGQFTESSASPYAGRAHVHWLTGTASTVMVGCVEGICGMRPDADGLAIRPSIPAEWDGMKMHKVFRGKQLNIIVQNPNHVESGVCALTLNGEALQGDYVPAEKLQDTNEIVVTLGK